MLEARREPLSRQRTQLAGVFLILGAAIGFASGFILVGAATAAIFGAAGAGLGIIVGAIADQASHRDDQCS